MKIIIIAEMTLMLCKWFEQRLKLHLILIDKTKITLILSDKCHSDYFYIHH